MFHHSIIVPSDLGIAQSFTDYSLTGFCPLDQSLYICALNEQPARIALFKGIIYSSLSWKQLMEVGLDFVPNSLRGFTSCLSDDGSKLVMVLGNVYGKHGHLVKHYWCEIKLLDGFKVTIEPIKFPTTCFTKILALAQTQLGWLIVRNETPHSKGFFSSILTPQKKRTVVFKIEKAQAVPLKIFPFYPQAVIAYDRVVLSNSFDLTVLDLRQLNDWNFQYFSKSSRRFSLLAKEEKVFILEPTTQLNSVQLSEVVFEHDDSCVKSRTGHVHRLVGSGPKVCCDFEGNRLVSLDGSTSKPKRVVISVSHLNVPSLKELTFVTVQKMFGSSVNVTVNAEQIVAWHKGISLEKLRANFGIRL